MNGLIYRALLNMPQYVWRDPTYPFVIPAINWEVMSHEQRVQWITCNIDGLIKYVNTFSDYINILDKDIETLANEFEKFKDSGFNDYYEQQVAQWIDEHLQFIFEHTVKQVYFGLTDDGYFCAYIPDSWSEIEFDTGMVFGQFDYGRLILRFDADGSGVIDNTGRYDEINTNISKVMSTLYAPMSKGGDL